MFVPPTPLIWMCLETWKPDCPTFSHKWALTACLDGLAAVKMYTLDGDRVLSVAESRRVVLFHPGRSPSLGSGAAQGAVRGPRRRPAGQISRIKPGGRSVGCQLSQPDRPRILTRIFNCWLRSGICSNKCLRSPITLPTLYLKHN